jgi:formate dehydrogenase beta subunit
MSMDTIVVSTWDGKVVDTRKAPTTQPTPPHLPQFPTAETPGALMGWNGLVVHNPGADIPALTVSYLKEARKLSCGECAVCMIGIDRLIELIGGHTEDRTPAATLGAMRRIITEVSATSKCAFGRSALSPVADALKHYKDAFVALLKGERPLKEIPYGTAVTAPCIEACPAHLDIPGYIELIRNARPADSLALIRERCILPGVVGRVCTHPCEAACVRTTIDAPLAIRLLKRAAADDERMHGGSALPPPPHTHTEKIAIIGAGPAGLSAASALADKGYPVTIFEALPSPGGMAVVGIPPYRLPRDILTHEIDLITRKGVELRTHTPLDRLSITALKTQGFAAVFLAIGAHQGNPMGVEGEDHHYEGFLDGVTLLRDLHLGKPLTPTTKVVVVGGGNVAMDCARSCVRLGFQEVTILYRRSRAEMPASDEEIEEASKEGVTLTFLAAPVTILAKNGAVTGLRCTKMKLGAPDASGRRRPIPRKGARFTIPADTVIAAIGQSPAPLSFTDTAPPELTRWGTFAVDPVTSMTTVEGVFAGGDCVTGPGILIEAMAMGTTVASRIDAYLTGKRDAGAVSFHGVRLAGSTPPGLIAPQAAEQVSLRDITRRAGNFEEVEGGFSPPEAIREAQRCLRCYRVYVWHTTEE